MESNVWKKYQKRGVQVIGVSIWAQGNPAEKAKSFAQQHKLTFPVLIDARDQTAKAFGVQGVPTNAVIGKNGKLAYLKAGYDESGVISAVQSALKAK